MNCAADSATIARQWFAPIHGRYNRSMTQTPPPEPKLSSLALRVAPEKPTTASANDDPNDDAWAVHNRAVEKSRNGEAVIFLSIGQETNETTPEPIVEQAIEALKTGEHHYADVEGLPELRQAIADYHRFLTGQSVRPDQCLVYAGAQNSLFSVALALLEPGTEVVLSEPYYTTYPATFTASGAIAKRVALRAEDNYQLNVDRLLAAITPNTRAIVINTPNNPMGECYSKADLTRLVNACKERGVWLVLDMVYAEIVEPDSVAFPHLIPGAEDILISIGSLSKSHRMTGWRAGWVVAPQRVAATLGHISLCMHYGLTPFVMKAATHAMNHDRETPAIIRKALAERREIVNAHLGNQPGVHLIDSGQGMFMLLDVTSSGLNAKGFAMELLEKTGVAVLPCDGFGATGANLCRISLAVDSIDLLPACNAIAAFIASRNSIA